jgi:hypothetical protein
MVTLMRVVATVVVGLLAPALHHKVKLDARPPLYRVAY